MIDRKTFRIAMAFVGIMLAAAMWRVSLLADWTHLPRYGEGGVALSPASSVWLLVSPGVVVLSMILLTVRSRMAVASDQDMQPWRRWARLYLVPYCVIVALFQGFVIIRSLGGLGSVSPILFSRAGFVGLGLLLMMMSNLIPKLPWLKSRIGVLNMDPDKGARLLRQRGRMGFVFGLIVIVCGAFLPLTMMPPIVFTLTGVCFASLLLFRLTANRGQVSNRSQT